MDFIFWSFEAGYFFQNIATIFQIFKILKRGNNECISLETNILFLFGAISRIFWISGNNRLEVFISSLEQILSIFSLCSIIFLYLKYKSKNYYYEIKLPFYLKLYFLFPIIIILSLCFNPGDVLLSDQVFVSFGIFCETVGLLPQLYILNITKDSRDLSEFYLLFLAIARLFRLFFWILLYRLGGRFFSLIIADIIYSFALFDVSYKTLKNWDGKGKGLPTSLLNLNNKHSLF